MSAARVLPSFSPSAMPGPVMPMDMAMRFYISHSPPPLRGFLSTYEDLHRARSRVGHGQRGHQQLYKPLRPCLSTQQRLADEGGRGAWSPAKPATNKKKVVFADSKGMSLTAVHVFSKFDDEPCRNRSRAGIAEELQFDMSDLEGATMDLKISLVRSLALDFKQPSADYLDFRNRLIQNAVCLESCSLHERSLTGTVKVRNLGFEKAVQVRVTFDSWASHTDVDCTFMNNVYGCQDTDTFAFVLELPTSIPPQNRVEFCVCFKSKDRIHWDNNDNKNYTLRHVGWNGEDLNESSAPPQVPVDRKKAPEHKNGGVKLLEMEFEEFGSPRMSSGLFPGWQSWGQIGNTVPYW